MDRIPHRSGGHLAADVDRRDARSWWLYVHGFGGDRGGAKGAAFREAAGAAGASFAAFDFRGHGESSGERADVTLSAMVEDLDVATDALVPVGADLVVVGSSLGAVACAWWAAARPGRARASVWIAPAFGFMERFLEELGPERAAAWAREGVLRDRPEWMEVPLRHAIAQDAARHDVADLAAAYRTDTLILHGLRDERVPWRVSVDFAERCPHRPLDVVLLGDGDHGLQGRVGDLVRWTREFVGRGSAARG